MNIEISNNPSYLNRKREGNNMKAHCAFFVFFVIIASIIIFFAVVSIKSILCIALIYFNTQKQEVGVDSS